MTAQLLKGVLIRTKRAIVEAARRLPGRSSEVVRRAHRCITSVRCRYPNHTINIFLYGVYEAFYDVDLVGTILNQLLDGMVNLLLVLTGVAHFEEFLLLSPLGCLSAHLRLTLLIDAAPVVEVAGHRACHYRSALLGRLIHVHVGAFIHDVVELSGMAGILDYSVSGTLARCLILTEILLLLQLLLFLFDELQDKLLFIYLIVGVHRVLLALLLHDEHGLMRPILNELVLNVLEHHVETVLDVVLCAAGHLLDDLRPLVANAETLLKDEHVFSERERILLDLGIEEVDPALSALLSVPVGAEIQVERGRNLAPLACAVLADQSDELFVFALHPVTLLNGRLFVLVKLVLALGVVPAWYEAGDLHPIVAVQLLRRQVLAAAILLDGPLKKARLAVCPILFGGIRLFCLQCGQLAKDFGGDLVRDHRLILVKILYFNAAEAFLIVIACV